MKIRMNFFQWLTISFFTFNIFFSRIYPAAIRVMILAKVMAKSSLKKPYTNQHNTPSQKSKNIEREIDLVSFVFHTLYTCGTKAMVVSEAAKKPK